MKETLATTAALATTTLALVMLAPTVAHAQDGTTTTTATATATTPAAPAPPAPPPPPAEHADDAVNDHDRFVGRLGVTYFDITNLPIANPQIGGAGGLTSSNVTAPVIGVRYWLMQRIGIDGGIGLGFAGGSDETVAGGTDTTVNKVASNGFAFHVGVPIVLAEAKHFTFLVIPQATLGFTSATYSPPAAGGGGPNQSLSGFLADVGARVGPEIHFGFIGLPQLALQATVGLSYRRSVYKLSSNGNSASDGTSTFGTQVNGDPWAIFTDGISATYYF
jgi:hypothetical protein